MDADDDPAQRSLTLCDAPTALAEVRRWVAGALTGATADELDDCLLIVTELVSNAYDHGRGPRRLRLIRRHHPPRIRFEVDDTDDSCPTLGRSRISDTRGRGMIIVDRLSEAWGVLRSARHKTVWAEIACSTGSPPAPA